MADARGVPQALIFVIPSHVAVLPSIVVLVHTLGALGASWLDHGRHNLCSKGHWPNGWMAPLTAPHKQYTSTCRGPRPPHRLALPIWTPGTRPMSRRFCPLEFCSAFVSASGQAARMPRDAMAWSCRRRWGIKGAWRPLYYWQAAVRRLLAPHKSMHGARHLTLASLLLPFFSWSPQCLALACR